MLANELDALMRKSGYEGFLFNGLLNACQNFSYDMRNDMMRNRSYWDMVDDGQLDAVEDSIFSYVFGNSLYNLMEMAGQYEEWIGMIAGFVNGNDRPDEDSYKTRRIAEKHISTLRAWEKFMVKCSDLAKRMSNNAANVPRRFQFKNGYEFLAGSTKSASGMSFISFCLGDLANIFSAYAKDLSSTGRIRKSLDEIAEKGYVTQDKQIKLPKEKRERNVVKEEQPERSVDQDAVFGVINEMEQEIHDLLDADDGDIPKMMRGIWNDSFKMDMTQYGISEKDQWKGLIKTIFDEHGPIGFIFTYAHDLRTSFGNSDFTNVLNHDVVSECMDVIDEHFGDYMGIIATYTDEKYGVPVNKSNIRKVLHESIDTRKQAIKKAVKLK